MRETKSTRRKGTPMSRGARQITTSLGDLGVLLLTAVLLFSLAQAPAASAESIHDFLYTVPSSEVPGGQYSSIGAAVDNYPASPSYGDLYLGSNSAFGSSSAVDKFRPEAATASYLCQITGLGSAAGHSSSECDTSLAGPGAFQRVAAVAVDSSSGAVYLDDSGVDELQRYAPTEGQYTLSFEGQTTQPISPEANAATIAAALAELSTIGAGNVEVVDTRSGLLVSFRGDLGGRNIPQLIAAGGSPTPVVSTLLQGSPSHIDRFGPTGAFEKQFTYPAVIPSLDVSIATGKVFLADTSNRRIVELNPLTEATAVFSTGADSPAGSFALGSEASNSANPFSVAVDNNSTSPTYEDVYVSDPQHAVVDRFGPGGEYQCQITGAGSASTSASECSTTAPGLPSGPFTRVEDLQNPGHFAGGPGALAVDPTNGHLYVAEERVSIVSGGNNGGTEEVRSFIDEFDATGKYLAEISPEEVPRGWERLGLAISAATGDLFVASLRNADEAYVFGPDKPLIQTAAATNATTTSATLNGTVDPLGQAVTECAFEYVEEAKYRSTEPKPYAEGQTIPCAESEAEIGSGNSAIPVHADLSGLQPGLVYHFRLRAANASGASYGFDQFFGPPLVDSSGAVEIGQNSVRLRGRVTTQQIDTHYRFEYGPTEAYGTSVPVSDEDIGSAAGETAVSQALTGLQLGTEYHFRLVAVNGLGTTTSPDQTFTTLPAALIDAQPASSIGKTSATLQAYLDPLGSATSYRFQWGETDSYGHETEPAPVGEGAAPVLGNAQLSGLQPGTTYHFRLVAENAHGTVQGPDESFTTEAAVCPNEKRREEDGSTALPDCRAYEQVSPAEKGGYPVDGVGGGVGASLAEDGERVKFSDPGTFAGQPGTSQEYVANRTAAGWQTEAIAIPNTEEFKGVEGFALSSDLTEALFMTPLGDKWTFSTRAEILFRRPDGTFSAGSPLLEPLEGNNAGYIFLAAVSPDLSTAVLGTPWQLRPDSLPISTLKNTHVRLYEVRGVGGPSPTLQLLQIDPEGNEMVGCSNQYPELSYNDIPMGRLNRVSSNGSRIFFTIASLSTGCGGPSPFYSSGIANNAQLYVRIDGSQTIAISNPSPNDECTTAACHGAAIDGVVFTGASSDGSKAFFEGPRQLTDEASQDPVAEGRCSVTTGPNGCNLYMYDFGRPAGHNLLALSAGESGGYGPHVQGVVGVSEDGSHAYFVAQGLLTAQPNALGQTAEPGAENLYVYDTGQHRLAFLARLCSGEERSGTLTGVPACAGYDGELWGQTNPVEDRSFVSPDGRFLTFTSHGRLTPDDENEAADVYRYDASNGALVRVSVGHDGEDQNGNAGAQAAFLEPRTFDQISGRPSDSYTRPMSEDGQTIVFKTARPLQRSDENGKIDVFEWHQGQVTLISGAASSKEIEHAAIDQSGANIVFETDAGLLHTDMDGLRDVYDARTGGGFPLPSPPESECEAAEACHGPPGPPPPLPPITHLGGEGNRPYCHKGFVLRHGNCVRKYHKRRHHHRQHKRLRAPHNLRGGK
jgi:hypothetical protein